MILCGMSALDVPAWKDCFAAMSLPARWLTVVDMHFDACAGLDHLVLRQGVKAQHVVRTRERPNVKDCFSCALLKAFGLSSP